MFAALTAAAVLSASAPEAWSADTLVWAEKRPGGTERTILEGDPDAPGGIVTYAFHMPDKTWFPAHSHPTAARVFVLKGVLLLGDGASGDRAKVRRVRAGEVVRVPAGFVHYEGAEGDTVIIGVAPGPWTTQFVAKP